MNRTPVRGTLVRREGEYRFYVNRGMRSAAAVEAGDRIRLKLQPTTVSALRLPPDLRAALRQSSAARMFQRLSPGYRRELLRYIDDATTARSRAKRITETVALVRSKRVTPKLDRPRPLWVCPKCGGEFVNRNQWHSCARHSIEDLFKGKSPAVRSLLERFRAIVKSCGPLKELAYRDRIVFMVRVRFAGAIPRRQWLDVGLWLRRRLSGRRFHKIETISPTVHIHLIRIREPADIDSELTELVREAYAVGGQA